MVFFLVINFYSSRSNYVSRKFRRVLVCGSSKIKTTTFQLLWTVVSQSRSWLEEF